MKAKQFMQQLLEDPDLRAEFDRDPRETASRVGAELDDNDFRALGSIDLSNTEALRKRANKDDCWEW